MNKLFLIFITSLFIFLTACSSRGSYIYKEHSSHIGKVHSQKNYYRSNTVDKKNYSHPTMKPYVVRGIRYHPTVASVGDRFKGNASWYGPNFHGKLTSNGETYNMWDMTAAHKTLPMNTIVKVTNLRNNMSIIVRINDRGPFVSTRIIDLSKAAASKINMIGHGTAPVILEVLGFEVKGHRKVKKHQAVITTKKVLKPHNNNQKNFALQIASFSNIEGALKIQEKYDNTSGYSTIIKDVQTGDSRIFKVLLKGFKSEAEVRDYKNNGIFKNSFIVKED